MIDWIHLGPPTTRVMDFIEFNNFFLFNYIIKIIAHEIEEQLKNIHLFETIILIESR
jgi:hypothetical protein